MIIISILGVIYLFKILIFLNADVVCAEVKDGSSIKGLKVLSYSYKYHGKTYNGSFNSSSGISMQPDAYKDNECLEVEVSKLIPSMSRVKVVQSKKTTENAMRF